MKLFSFPGSHFFPTNNFWSIFLFCRF